MAQQIIDLTGSTVDSVRVAFNKVNENFTEVFTTCGPAGTGTYANTVSQTASLIVLGDLVTAASGDSVSAAFAKIVANFSTLYAVLPGTQQIINLGSGPNTQTGDTVVSAFGKINTNFTNLYTTLGLTTSSPESEDPAYTSFTPTVYDLSRDTVNTSSTVDDANTFADPFNTGIQLIDLGAGPDTQTGDSVYVAFTKVNHNFVELYDVFGPNGNTNIQGNTITANNFVTPATGIVRTGSITAYGNVETTGNIIAAGFFYPNGAAISGTGPGSYGNANVADYLASNSNITITTTANITGRYFFGNGSQLTGLSATNYGNANVATFLANFGSNIISTTGNIVASYFVGNFAGNISGNLTAAGANTQVLFNDAGSVNATSGFTFNKTTSLVTIGGNLTVSGNGSILLPRGTDAQRPSPATTGMFRFSNTSSKVEWYTGSTWQAPITDFTLTTANAQSGDGSTTVFLLPVANASTAGTIISINGIVQRPISAYSITSGNVTFTEAPSPTDVVDFRIFTTTSSISTVADIYQTTGMFLDQTSGDQVIHLKTAGVDSLRIEANTKVDISGNLGVGGSFTALTKSFLIDHPSKPGYKLQYASLEGPEHGVYIRGRIEGRNVFELPAYWVDLVDPGTISVHITPIGTQQNLYVEDIKNNIVYVAGSIDPYYTKFFYIVYGERKDVGKLLVEYN